MIFLPVIVIFAGAACQKKSTTPSGEGLTTELMAVEKVDPSEVVQLRVEPAELGFATRLPASIELYASIYNPADILKAMIGTDVSELFLKRDVEEINAEGEEAITMGAAIKEIDEMMVGNAFLCVDQGLAAPIKASGEMYQMVNATYVSIVTKIMSRYLKMENPEFFAEEKDMQNLLAELFGGVAQLEKLIDNESGAVAIPSVYVGCQPPEEKMDEWHHECKKWLAESADEQEGVEPYEFDKYGVRFEGIKLTVGALVGSVSDEIGGELEKELEDELDDDVEELLGGALDQALAGEDGTEWMDRVTERIKKSPMIVVTAVIDGHLVLFIGDSEESLVLVDQVKNSLAGRSEFDQLGGGHLMGAWYASETLIESFQSWQGYEKVYRGLASTFQQEKLPNHESISVKLGRLADMEKKLVVRDSDDFLMLCLLDQGVKLESVGGRHEVDLDISKPLRLPSVVDSMEADLFLKAHWMVDQSHQSLKMDYVELLFGVMGETLDGGCLAFLERNEISADWYLESKKMYDEIVAPELTRFWGGYRQLSLEALDGESAVMMDLNGEFPRVPKVPANLIKEGKVPRLVLARPINDRQKLSDSYTAFTTTGENVLEYTSILVEKELPMPIFLSSDKGGLTTWFYPFPFLSNDFVPCVSASDTLWMAGTSKNWSQEIHMAWQESVSDGVQKDDFQGAMVEMKFSPLWDFTADWLDLTEKEQKRQEQIKVKQVENEEKVGTADDSNDLVQLEEDTEEDLDEDDPFDFDQARKILDRLRDLESIRWHRREQAGKMRDSLVIKVKP